MKLNRFPSKQVLVVGPGFSTLKIEKQLHDKNIPVVFTSRMVDELLPEYNRLDARKKSERWRPLIDKATDLVISANCLINVPEKSLIVVDRVTALFMNHTVNSKGNPPYFICIDDPHVLAARCSNPEPLSDKLSEKWVERCNIFRRIYSPKSVVVTDIKPDLSEIVAVISNHRGDMQWGLTELGSKWLEKGEKNGN